MPGAIRKRNPGRIYERALDLDRAQRQAQHIAKREADEAADQAQNLPFEHEDRAHRAFTQAERFHDGDVARFFVSNGRDDVVRAEARHQENRAHDGVHDDIADNERAEQILMRLLPRDGFVAGLPLYPRRHLARSHRVDDANPDLVYQPGLPRENLSRAHQRVGGAFVDRAHAGMEEADHLGVDARALAGLHRNIGADAGPDLFTQPVAENDGVGGAIERGE